MRSYIIMGLIALLLAAGSLWSNNFINTSTVKLVQDIGQVEKRIDSQEWDKANNQLKLVKTDWDHIKDIWSVLLTHDEIDKIDIGVTRLTEYLRAKSPVLAAGEVSTLRLLFEHISDTESFNLKNIF